MKAITIERDPPLRHVRIDTGRRNILNLAALRALRSALERDDDAPVVILTGRSDAFSAGLDNAAVAEGTPEREELLAEMGELLLQVYGGPTRLVTACRGHAVAAGAMLLLVADVRIGTQGDYKIGFTEPSQGMALPSLAALLARDRLDRRRLQQMTVVGKVARSTEGVEIGFLDECVVPEAFEAITIARARELAEMDGATYEGTVAAVRGVTLDRMATLVERQRKISDTAG